ncbi:MAG: hypothetical protein IJP26_01680 [Clostridia bacterium]|nr:hypothetical protein [Clostridia bacterium]
MECENLFCIYQENNHCILNEITLDIVGQCDSCIYVEIPKFELENYKIQLRNKLKSY